MSGLPLEGRKAPSKAKAAVEIPKEIKVTQENYGPIMVHYLQLIYGRMGYLIKLLEKEEVK